MNQSSSSSPPLSLSSLTSLLKSHIPSELLSTWGVTPGTKTIYNLHLEIHHGDSALTLSLSPTTLLRTVHVASLHIKNPLGATLIESHQLLSDGSTRTRNRPLSEKMRPGESIDDAAMRAVKEELGVAGGVEVVMGSYEVREEERDSVSYPGLRVRYVLHSVEVRVVGIPEDGEFETDEEGEGIGEDDDDDGGCVFVRKHFWKWVNDDGN